MTDDEETTSLMTCQEFLFYNFYLGKPSPYLVQFFLKFISEDEKIRWKKENVLEVAANGVCRKTKLNKTAVGSLVSELVGNRLE